MIYRSAVPRGCYFGGNANNGANAGLVYANSNNAPSNSNANIGSRLYFPEEIENIRERRPCLSAEKLKRTEEGAGRDAHCTGYRRLRKRKSKHTGQMKRIGNLYHRIISVENLELADRKARKGKYARIPFRRPDGSIGHKRIVPYGIRLFDRNREANIMNLYDALLTKTFRPSSYCIFIRKEKKERTIYRLPYYPDRIVHHAIMNVLEPIWIKTFTYNTYSCIKGRGIEGCARQVDRIIRKYRDGGKSLFCLKIDLKKFYPSIDRETLKGIIRRKIKDRDLLWLLDTIIDDVRIDAPCMAKLPQETRERIIEAESSGRGTPLGNYLSQFFGNLLLCYFMHEVNERLPEEVREKMKLAEKPMLDCTEYADDIVFFSDSKEVLRTVFEIIRDRLENGLKLKIKNNYQIFPVARNRQDRHGRGLDYVGYVFYKEQKLLRKSIKQRFCRAAAKLEKRKIKPDRAEYRQALAPWLGWARHSNSRHLLKKITREDMREEFLKVPA